MANVYERYYERQPAAVKVIAVAGLALGGYLVYRAVKRAKDEKDATKAAQDAANELLILQNQGINPTYADSQFQSFCDALVQAMNGCGTDESAIYQIFGYMRNDADIRKLVTTFGIRYIEPCWISQSDAYAIWLFNDKAYGGELASWLNFDLSSSEIAKVNSILKGNGINYQF
jgi:hypothetical protein